MGFLISDLNNNPMKFLLQRAYNRYYFCQELFSKLPKPPNPRILASLFIILVKNFYLCANLTKIKEQWPLK